MTKIQDLATSLEAEVAQLKQKYEDKLAELALTETALKERDAKSKAKKADLDIREKQIATREAKVEKDLQKIRNDEEISESLIEASRKEEIAKETLKDGEMKLAEAKLREEQISERELAVSDREANYRKEIKQQFVDSILKK